MARKKKVDLANLFESVTHTLAENQQVLNQEDSYNHDHGSNMVQNFQTITDALKTKRRSSSSAALNYAARQLSQSASGSSGQQYAANLSQAARQMKGKTVDASTAMQLLQTMIGGGQAASQTAPDSLGGLFGGAASSQGSSQGQTGADSLQGLLGGLLGGGGGSSQGGGDLLGQILGGMSGGAASPQSSSQPGGDLLGQLLGGLMGGSGSSSSQGGVDMGDLFRIFAAFMQARQSGKDVLPALIQAFLANSGMGNSRHRNQSTELVVNSYLQALMDAGGRS